MNLNGSNPKPPEFPERLAEFTAWLVVSLSISAVALTAVVLM
jgi:hypothetical protein